MTETKVTVKETTKMVLLVALEGNISAGKSSVSKAMPKEHNGRAIHIRYETIPKGLLALFYSGLSKKPNPYAFTLQINQLARRSSDIQLALCQHRDEKSTVILDRSLIGDMIFAFQHYLNGNITDEEMGVYLEEANISDIGSILGKLDQIYYLVSPASKCLTNVRKRGDVDSTIPLSLLTELEILHNHIIWWLIARFPSLNITLVDWSNFGKAQTLLDNIGVTKGKVLFLEYQDDDYLSIIDRSSGKKLYDAKTGLVEIDKDLFPQLKDRKILNQDVTAIINESLIKGLNIQVSVRTRGFIFDTLDKIYQLATKS